MAMTKEEVRKVYKKHFEAVRESADAHNRTLEELSPPFSREMSDEDAEKRRKVGDFIREIQRQVETEFGDPFWLAVNAAMESLKRDNALEAVHDTWKDIVKTAEEEFRSYRVSPLDWSPRKLPFKAGFKPKSVEDILERIEGPYLYVMFDDDGSLDSWTINYSDYWGGHGGPVAAIGVHDAVTWSDIEREVANELGEAEIEWPELEEEE
jgi:hypothetical protein